jgi:hypothetical protein
MNIPQSAIEPFGVIGIPKFRWRRDDKIRQLVAYARMMYNKMSSRKTQTEIELLEILMMGRHGAYDISITWVKEEFQRGYHRFRFRIPDERGLITAYLHPSFGSKAG